MSDKIHANWIAATVPTWEEIKPHTLERYVIDKQAAEIDALRKRVQELESAHQEPAVARGVSELETVVQSLCVWGKFQDDAGEATNALSDLLEQLKSVPQVPPPDVHAEFVRWAHNYIDTKLYEGMKGPTDIEGHPV